MLEMNEHLRAHGQKIFFYIRLKQTLHSVNRTDGASCCAAPLELIHPGLPGRRVTLDSALHTSHRARMDATAAQLTPCRSEEWRWNERRGCAWDGQNDEQCEKE